MTTEEILRMFSDINYAYNDCSKYDSLKRMLNDLTEQESGEWIDCGKQMIINLENAREQYSVLGYPHRNELRLQCSSCGKITLVDESIVYEFCPHCGAMMRRP